MPVMGGFKATEKIRDHYKEQLLLNIDSTHKMPYIVAISASNIDQ